MRINTCAMMNKLQSLCWSDNEEFKVENQEVVGFRAHKERLEGMITHCRQDIPLGEYDRKHRRWTLKGKHKEVEYLVNLVKKGYDVSLDILDKLRSTPWRIGHRTLKRLSQSVENEKS